MQKNYGRSGWPVKLEFIEIILKFRMDCQVGLMGQPGWMVRSLVRSPGDLDSVAPGPVYQKPFPTSAPTLEDFKRLEGGGMGQRWEGMGSHYGGDWSSRGV